MNPIDGVDLQNFKNECSHQVAWLIKGINKDIT